MKGEPLGSLAHAVMDPLGLPCSIAAVNDAPERSHVGWRLERAAQPGTRSAPTAQRSAESADGAEARRSEPLASALAAADDATEAASAEQAYQLWKGRVWRFASRLGVPSEQLEDATQDVFTAVFRRWNDFRAQSTRRTWVLGFVPRIASSYRRRRRPSAEPTREASAEGALASVPSREHDPFESTARREARRIIGVFLDGLPELDRQLFVLVELEDASVVEAAAILELGPRRAYKILDRARRALEATLVRQRAADSRRLP